MPRRCSNGAAKAKGADLIMFPELQLTGYPPEDLVLKPEFVRRTMEAADRLVEATAEPGPAMLFGSLIAEGGVGLQRHAARRRRQARRPHAEARAAQLRHVRREARLRRPARLPEPIAWRGVKLGVPICEDIWQDRVCAHLAEAGADFLLVPNGSPFEIDKDDKRQQLVRSRVVSNRPARSPISTASAARTSWRSTAPPSSSTPTASGSCRCCDWEEQLLLTEWEKGASGGWRCVTREACDARCLSRRTSTTR